MQNANFITHFEKILDTEGTKPALIFRDKAFSYQELKQVYQKSLELLTKAQVKAGQVVTLQGDFDPQSIALFFALLEKKVIIVPLLRSHPDDYVADCQQIAGAEHAFKVGFDQQVTHNIFSHSHNELVTKFKTEKEPGLILFSSGSTGKPKAALHNFSKLLSKFITPPHYQRMINFLMFDHWGGLNTLLHIVGGAGTVVVAESRTPEKICELLEKWKIEILPTSPSFLNLLLLSQAYKKHNLNHLKLITYGSEPMPETTLEKAHKVFPQAKFKQTYGLIELGVFKTKSKSSDSLFIKIDPEDCQYRIVDGMLELKTQSAMLGYLNAPSPFTEDGWFKTQDAVEVDGEYLKILGRKSDIIIMGGEKVYPLEVEGKILEFPNVEDVVVYKESHPLMGNIVCARIKLIKAEDEREFIIKLKNYCKTVLPAYKIPAKIKIMQEALVGSRQKKMRL